MHEIPIASDSLWFAPIIPETILPDLDEAEHLQNSFEQEMLGKYWKFGGLMLGKPLEELEETMEK